MKDPSNHNDAARRGIGKSTSWSLLERVKVGEAEGWRQLEYLYRPLVLAQCRRAGLRGSEAEDIAQEVFKTLVTKIQGFRKQPGPSFRSWLRGITRHKIGDHFRRCRDQARAAGGTDAQDALGQVPDQAADVVAEADELSERRLLCRRALMLVSSEYQPRSWQAVWRVVVENQTPSDVAADLGMTPNAVYVAKSRILCRLREVLVELGESTYEAADMASCPEGFEQ